MNDAHLPIERLIDYLHRELAPDEDARVLAHLDSCAACRSAYDEEAELSDRLHSYAQGTQCDLPPGLATRIRARAHASTSSVGSIWIRRWMRPLVGVPIGAALALAIYFTNGALHHGAASAKTISAIYYLEDHAALTSTVPFASTGSVVPAALASDDAGADQEWVEIGASQTNASP